jgi:hypothetical protein
LETKPAEPQTKQPDPPTKSEEIPTENEEKQTETPDTTAVPAETKEKEPEKAEETPETKTEFQQEITDETQIPGQTELIKDFPEYCPPDMNTTGTTGSIRSQAGICYKKNIYSICRCRYGSRIHGKSHGKGNP